MGGSSATLLLHLKALSRKSYQAFTGVLHEFQRVPHPCVFQGVREVAPFLTVASSFPTLDSASTILGDPAYWLDVRILSELHASLAHPHTQCKSRGGHPTL